MGPVDYVLLLADLIVEVCCVVCLLKRRAFSQYFTIVLYLCASIAVGIGRYGIIAAAGYSSAAYLYFFYYSDAVLTICLYFVLMSLYSHVFSEMGISKFVRGGALWGAMMKLRENRTRLMQLVLAMGVYFSAFAGSYALGNLYQDMPIWHYICHLMVIFLPLSWAYTFMKVPEEARMGTATVLAPNR